MKSGLSLGPIRYLGISGGGFGSVRPPNSRYKLFKMFILGAAFFACIICFQEASRRSAFAVVVVGSVRAAVVVVAV